MRGGLKQGIRDTLTRGSDRIILDIDVPTEGFKRARVSAASEPRMPVSQVPLLTFIDGTTIHSIHSLSFGHSQRTAATSCSKDFP
jgi:hypothetical protein